MIDQTDMITEAAWTAPRPRWWEAWSDAERSAWLEWQTASDDAHTASALLRPALSPEALTLWLREEERHNRTEMLWLELVRARLQRFIPGYADVIETVFAIEAQGWGMPEGDTGSN